MSNVPPAAAVAQIQYTQASTTAALMDCLCKLQEQGGYQQMATAVLAGNLTGAQRAYRQLKQRVPRKPPLEAMDADQPDPLDQAFAVLGEALATGNSEHARQALAALQQAVQHAGVHHRHDKPVPASHDETGPQVEAQPSDRIIDIKV